MPFMHVLIKCFIKQKHFFNADLRAGVGSIWIGVYISFIKKCFACLQQTEDHQIGEERMKILIPAHREVQTLNDVHVCPDLI